MPTAGRLETKRMSSVASTGRHSPRRARQAAGLPAVEVPGLPAGAVRAGGDRELPPRRRRNGPVARRNPRLRSSWFRRRGHDDVCSTTLVRCSTASAPSVCEDSVMQIKVTTIDLEIPRCTSAEKLAFIFAAERPSPERRCWARWHRRAPRRRTRASRPSRRPPPSRRAPSSPSAAPPRPRAGCRATAPRSIAPTPSTLRCTRRSERRGAGAPRRSTCPISAGSSCAGGTMGPARIRTPRPARRRTPAARPETTWARRR